jgi:hypothetical protein
MKYVDAILISRILSTSQKLITVQSYYNTKGQFCVRRDINRKPEPEKFSLGIDFTKNQMKVKRGEK